MPQERKLLSQVRDGRAGLYPEFERGGEALKKIVGLFLGDLAVFTDVGIDSLVRSDFFKTLEEEAQIQQGNIQDIVEKIVKMTEITLTNQNLFLFYKKGFISKQKKLIVLPLKYATGVRTEEIGKRIVRTEEGHIMIESKSVYVTFEVTQKGKDKPRCFDLALVVNNPWIWVNAIARIIGKFLPTPREEKVLGSVRVARHGGSELLYFTQKRVIVAKAALSLKWVLLISIISIPASVLFFVGLLVNIRTGPYAEARIFLLITLLLFLGPWLFLAYMENMYKKIIKRLSKSPPESILTEDKKNFEIPYRDITRLEVKKGRFFPHKIKILTNSEKHEFKIAGKKNLANHVRLVCLLLPESKIILPKKEEAYVCKNCGYFLPKKVAVISGWDSEHCPICGKIIARYVK